MDTGRVDAWVESAAACWCIEPAVLGPAVHAFTTAIDAAADTSIGATTTTVATTTHATIAVAAATTAVPSASNRADRLPKPRGRHFGRRL